MNLIRSVDHKMFHKKVNYINKLILPLANKEQVEQSANMIKQYGYNIDFKKTLFNYINLFNIKINDSKILSILYFDEIGCNNVLGSYKKKCEWVIYQSKYLIKIATRSLVYKIILHLLHQKNMQKKTIIVLL
uniref:Reverse transcriptase domain-containing protein n=1 Tax=Strongyloides venezuelensis TaxID=75913 RepID=A0A0K0FGN6_STRVS